MPNSKGEKSPTFVADPFEDLAIELGIKPRKITTMKAVFHLMYAEFRFEIDTNFETPDEIIPFLENISKVGIKPQPAFTKFEKKDGIIGKMGEIMFIDEGKTKGDKACFFVRIKPDGSPENMPKSEMIEVMQMPIAKGKKNICIWDVGQRVVVIKNDRGFIDLDDATDMTEDMTEDEKKS